MSLDRNFVLKALLQHNYFPTQKKNRDELPAIFTSSSFSVQAARNLAGVKQRDRTSGWDTIQFTATKFSGVQRYLAIPHPLAHAHLCLCIYEHWDKLEYIAKNKTSLIRPRQHKDGRILIMDYDSSLDQQTRGALHAFGKRFMVHTDIANFFPSIYSHAVPWAVAGFKAAKANRGNAIWFNQLDAKLRGTKRNETQGVAIGPATSNIVAEAILARIDEQLVRANYDYVRYIDDYRAYCETEDRARDFIRELSIKLLEHKLLLSVAKTEVAALPQPSSDQWVLRLGTFVPRKSIVNAYEASSFLEQAVAVSKEFPKGSVLKYAVATILSKRLSVDARSHVLQRVLEMAFHQPALLPLLRRVLPKSSPSAKLIFGPKLHALAEENAKFYRSDGMCWTLFYLNNYCASISSRLADMVLASRDCLSLLLLYRSGQASHLDRVVDFAKNLDATDHYELDQYWMLLYQLFLDGLIPNPYPDEEAFEVLKAEGVRFV
jgi:hypothetical protein